MREVVGSCKVVQIRGGAQAQGVPCVIEFTQAAFARPLDQGTPPRKQFCAIAVFGPELPHASVASVVFCCLAHVEDTTGLKDIGAAGLWGISALFTLFL